MNILFIYSYWVFGGSVCGCIKICISNMANKGNNNNNNNDENYVPSNNNNNNNNNNNWNSYVNENENRPAGGNLLYKKRRGNWTPAQKNAMKWILERRNPINNIQRNKTGKPIEKNGSTLAIKRYSIANYLRTLRNVNGKPIKYDPSKNVNYYLEKFNNKSRAQIERTHLNNKTKLSRKLVNSVDFVKTKAVNLSVKHGLKTVLGPAYPFLLVGKFIHGGGIQNSIGKIQSAGKFFSLGLTIRHFYFTMLALSGGEKSRTVQLVIEQINKSKKNLNTNNKNSKLIFEQYKKAAEQFKRNGMRVTNNQADDVIQLLTRYLVSVLVNKYEIKTARNTSLNIKIDDYFGKVVTSTKEWAKEPTKSHYEAIRISIAKFLVWLVIDGLGFTDPRVDPNKQINKKAFDSLYHASHLMLNHKSANRTPYQKYLMGKKMGHFLTKFYQLYSELPAGDGKFKKRVIASLNKNIITGISTAMLNNAVGNNQSNRIQKIFRSSVAVKQKINDSTKKIELAGKVYTVYSKGKVHVKRFNNLVKIARKIILTPSLFALKDLFVAMYLLKYGYSHFITAGLKTGNWALKKYGANTYNENYSKKHNVNIKKLKSDLQDDLLELKALRYSENARIKMGIRNINQQSIAEKKLINKILTKYDIDTWRTIKESDIPYGLTNVYNSARRLFFFNS